jgi:hypothetical protein
MPKVFSGLAVPKWWISDAGLILPSSVRDLHVEESSASRQARFAGLLRAERPRPLGNIAAYATPQAMQVATPSLDDFLTTLNSIPLGMLLPVICELQALLHDIETDAENQIGLAAGLFGGTQAFKALERFVRAVPGQRVIFCEQAFTLLQLLTILVSEEDHTGLSQDEYTARIRSSIFFISGYLEQAGSGPAEDRTMWLRHLTQLFEYNGKPVFGNAMARTWAIFGRLHRDSSDIKPDVPLDRWLREDYGLGLEQQMSLGFALFAHLGTKGDDDAQFASSMDQDALAGIFHRMDLGEDESEAAEAMIAAPPSWFRTEIEGQTVGQLSWNRVPFMQRPFIRLQSGQYLLQSPRALLAWIAEGVHYRCLDSARKRDAVGAYATRIGKLTERYVLRLTESAHREPRLPGAGKVHGDKKFANGIDSSDITITYPNEVVLMEVASHRLTVKSKRDGDQHALERDLTEMVGRRPKQLRRSINAMKPTRLGHVATLRFQHLDPNRIARFWPIIITMTPLHWSPLLEEFLTPSLAELDGRTDVEALDVIAVEDLEALVAITEETGRPLADLLAAKQGLAGAHADVRTWIGQDRHIPNIARPHYLDDMLDEAMTVATKLLGYEDVEEGSAA